MRILREQCEAWRTRPLADVGIIYLFLDAIHLRVRVDRRVQVVPVLVALGVTTTWPKTLVQRCVVHKLHNLEAHAPKRACVRRMRSSGSTRNFGGA